MKLIKRTLYGGLSLMALTLFSCKSDSSAAAPEAAPAEAATADAAPAAEAKTISLKVAGMT